MRMSRASQYKLVYLIGLALVVAAAVLVVLLLGGGVPALLVVVVILLVSGRVQGYFYRDLFRGRRLLGEGRFVESISYNEHFLSTVQRKPWLKQLLWLSWSIYTPNVEAMTLNNLGAAHLELRNFDQATSMFSGALARDPEFPMPYYNLALMREVLGDHGRAELLLSEASKRGYKRTSIDQLVSQAGEVYARLEGRGVS